MFDELTAIREVRDGTSLTEYDEITPIMVLAAMSVRNAWKEIPEKFKVRKFAKMAVMHDFRALKDLPENLVEHCAVNYAIWGRKITRADLKEYMQILNSQEESFIKSILKKDPGLIKFVEKNSIRAKRAQAIVASSQMPKTQIEKVVLQDHDYSTLDFTDTEYGSESELTPEAFLSRDVERQTKEDLEELLNVDVDFPLDFIARLQTPFRNEYYYSQKGNTELASEWKQKQIPWLNKDICEHIADIHPEASVATPQYLKKEAVKEYFNYWKDEEHLSKALLKNKFLLFPEEFLDAEMLQYIEIDWQVLNHAPSLCLHSEYARLYLNRHPGEIFRLKEDYQTVGKLLADGVNITRSNLPLIKNEEIRAKIAAALGLEDEEQLQKTTA